VREEIIRSQRIMMSRMNYLTVCILFIAALSMLQSPVRRIATPKTIYPSLIFYFYMYYYYHHRFIPHSHSTAQGLGV
jgi:cellulose synthase/poly-beta-1,6-N-acetylglucosamine synthase-like glycosyltransferase